MPLIPLQEVIALNTSPATLGSVEISSTNSVQLVVNRFAHRFDADIRDYVELKITRVLSGALQKPEAAR